MAGNLRFESNSNIPEELGFIGNFPNGQRGNYPSATMDRSGSFREGNENRAFSSGASTLRATASLLGDVGPITHFLLLDPITMGEKKYTRSGELRQVLGISLGNGIDDNAFGAAHPKPLPSVAIEELKQIKASVMETTLKARGRYKRFNESLLKLNKYCEALNLRKQQRNEISTNEKSVGSKLLKVGIQVRRNSPDLGTQRLEDKAKNAILNKRVRSSVAELRADERSNALLRQHLVMGKDREMLKDGCEASDLIDEKIRRLPAGGEGWGKKMKKKRSVGSVLIRPTDSDREIKRAMHHKLSNEPGLLSYDAQGLRSRSFNGTSGTNHLDSTSLPGSSNSNPKNEPEKVSLTRDSTVGMNKERLVTKANKLNILEDNHIGNSSPVTKGKASRAPGNGSALTANLIPSFPCAPGTLEVWEQPPTLNNVNSVVGPNNRKRSLSTGSSSPPMAWIGQRPQKISRTRRANVVSPISNQDDMQMSSEVGLPSDFASPETSFRVGFRGSPLAKDVANGTRNMKDENVSSPARLYESEESGAAEIHEPRAKEKNTGIEMEQRLLNQNVGISILLTKKNKVLNKEDIADGVRRLGRSGCSASSSKAGISMEKLGNPSSVKPFKNTRTISDKDGSKSGRPPLKKTSDRKANNHLAQTGNTGSFLDLSGDSDDDREELLAAAKYACNANYLSCSGSFWKKLELVFGPVFVEYSSYLQQEMKSSEELHKKLSNMFGHCYNNMSNVEHEGDCLSQFQSEESERSLQDHVQLKTLIDLVDQEQDGESILGSTERNKAIPLYQRVLSALIVEDGPEEFKESNEEKIIFNYYNRDNTSGDNCFSIDFEFEPRNRNGIECDCDSVLGFETEKQSPIDHFSCNGITAHTITADYHNEPWSDELFQGIHGHMHSKTGMFTGFSENSDVKPLLDTNASAISASDCQYKQMSLEDRFLMELQSIGLYPEAVPDLADGEDEAINQEITRQLKGLHQQVGKKKAYLSKISKAIENGKEMERWTLEQVAMNRLVEVAYKKQLATRGSYASKYGVPKVSKQVALAFMKRTLARCRKLEDTGKSCFSEPALRDIILSTPTRGNGAEIMNFTDSTINSIEHPGTPTLQQDFPASGYFPGRVDMHDLRSDKFPRGLSEACGTPIHLRDRDFTKTGPVSNRGKKKELLLDDVGSNASFRATSSPGNTLLGGVKGKRSERERDRDALSRNPVTKASRASQNNAKGDRKTKSKPKQKIAQLLTSGDQTTSKLKELSSNKNKEAVLTSLSSNPQDPSSKRSRETRGIADLQEFELNMANDFDGHQDLNNWFNFDDDGLPEHDLPMDGLEIPMDDIFEVFG